MNDRQHTYTITPYPGIMNHNGQVVSTAHDELSDQRMQLMALVRSGDYIGTLATALDAIAESMRKNSPHEYEDMQHIISDLFYLEQQQYTVVKKTSA